VPEGPSADGKTLRSCRGFADKRPRTPDGAGAGSGWTPAACLTSSRHLQVAQEALGRVAIRKPTGTEPGTMRIHAPPQRRVAGETVALRMAGGATLEAVARRSSVLQQPLRLCGVEGGIETSPGRQPAITMTASTEQFGIVAGRTLVLPTV
jgi:hypothetical protein